MSRNARAYKYDSEDLKNALAPRAEEVAAWLYPEGKRVGGFWVVGDIEGRPGDSFKVNLTGKWAGMAREWADGVEGKPVSLIDCYMVRCNCTFPQAVEDLADWMRVPSSSYRAPAPRLRVMKKPEPYTPVPMSDEVREVWSRGVIMAREHTQGFAEELAGMRGWPLWSCMRLLTEGVMAPVQWRGRRVWAFPVKAPKPEGGLETIGLHLLGRDKEGKRRWEYTAGCKAFPFIIGNPFKASTWLITEGQWDALSVMVALTPQNPHTIREGICVLGIRGANGTGPFLEHYGPLLKGGQCILLPDNDKAGDSWDTLADDIERLGGRVAVFDQPGGVKDANDALRAGMLTRSLCLGWLNYKSEGWK
jgi:hypothetical protein